MPGEMSGPLVSVIVPMFNSERTIGRALSSVFAQTYDNLEVIVVDDGSTDRCADIVRGSFERACLLSQTNAGAAAARNRAASVASGGLLAFLDADDEWHKRKIELQIAALKRFPEAAICATRPLRHGVGQDWCFQPDAPVNVPDDLEVVGFAQLFADPYLATPTVVMRRDVFRACGGFDEQLHGAEDVDLWLRAAYRRMVIRLTATLAGVARMPDSLTARLGTRTDLDNLRVIEKFVQANPEFVSDYAGLVCATRASVKVRLGSTILSRGDRHAAREIIFAALRDKLLNPRAIYLLLKTWLPCQRSRDGGRNHSSW